MPLYFKVCILIIIVINMVMKITEVIEGWSDKYKKSINCNNPKGFSQKAHCAGRKKKKK